MLMDCPPLPVPMPVFVQQIQAKLPKTTIVSAKLSPIGCLVELELLQKKQAWVDYRGQHLMLGVAYSLETGSLLSPISEGKPVHEKQ